MFRALGRRVEPMRVVAGDFRGRALAAPKSVAIRPTADRVREAIFDVLTARLGPRLDAVAVLDLFAGTGAMGIEALSRGASSCVFVDSGVEARALVRDNVERFAVAGRVRMLRRNATDLGPVGNLGPFDLVFADPPYRRGLAERALGSALSGGWIAPGALIVIEQEASTAAVEIAGFEQLDCRDYGAARIVLLTLSGGQAEGGDGRR